MLRNSYICLVCLFCYSFGKDCVLENLSLIFMFFRVTILLEDQSCINLNCFYKSNPNIYIGSYIIKILCAYHMKSCGMLPMNLEYSIY